MILGPTKMKGSLTILMTLIITITCDRARVDPGNARLDARDGSSVGRIDAGDARAVGRIDARDGSSVGRIDAGDARAVGRIDARDGSSVGRIDAGDERAVEMVDGRGRYRRDGRSGSVGRIDPGIEGTLIKNL